MKDLLKRLTGANRLKVIAVIGVTRAEVELGVAHARTSGSQLPLWAWCAEIIDSRVEGCDRFSAGAGFWRVRKDLRSVWPALIIVAWTGERRAAALKLLPFTVPPFRIVVFNEARGFFAAKPGPLAEHALRRLGDAAESAARRAGDWTSGLGQWLRSLAYRAREWTGNVAMAWLGFVAQCTPPVAYAAMQRLRASHTGETISDIVMASANGCGFTEVAIPARGWPRCEVIQAIHRTEAEFIVFRRLGENAPAQPFVNAARQMNAFALAKQSAYTGWRRQILTKHPFRKLQPGEATQVFAPYSSLIVTRRDMLLRFGVPNAFTYGAALMIVFWKAGAAGLPSFVMGHAGEITQEPAMALEDAELVGRIALSRELRGMGPAHSHRSRGNIAFSAPHRGAFRGKPRVLVVSPYLPFPLSHGGAVRMYNLCRALSNEIDFVLACFREAGEVVRYDELHEVFREVYVVDADEKHTDPAVPKQVAEYRNTAMDDLVRRLCLAREVDLVQLEYTQMAEFRNQTGAIPLILVEHDITFTLYRQLADASPDALLREQYGLWRTFEREALQCSNAVWTMSEMDRAVALEHGAPQKSTSVVPNGVDLRRFQPVRRQTRESTILFVGSFRHLPNLLAFEALRQTIMPTVWQTCPSVKLHVIAGPHHARAARTARRGALLAPDPRITIEGFVEDVRPAYRECDVVVIPLPVSAGTNIKLMEAMACGRAIVCTPPGCQGLDLQDGHHLLIRDTGPEFAKAVALFLSDDDLRQRIAARARATAESRFGWDAVGRRALESYGALLGRIQDVEDAVESSAPSGATSD